MSTSRPKTLREVLAEMGLAKERTLYDTDDRPRWVKWKCRACGEKLVCYRRGPLLCPSCHAREVA